MNRAKIYKVNLDVYKRSVWIVYTSDVVEYATKLIKKMPALIEAHEKPPGPGDWAITLYNYQEYDTGYLILPKGTGAPLLAHEVVHLAHYVAEFFGLEGTEVVAYLVQHIMEHVYK